MPVAAGNRAGPAAVDGKSAAVAGRDVGIEERRGQVQGGAGAVA